MISECCGAEDALSRFESKYTPVTESGCWLWIGSVSSSGYGGFRYNKKMVSAHRASWMLHNGEISADMLVCHKCDTPLCVNPDHLFLGTQKDNMQDKLEKSRDYNGSDKRYYRRCKRGHEFTPENTIRNGVNTGKRTCRICIKLRRENNVK